MVVTIVVFAFKRLTDKYGRQVGEDERLDKRHQYFDEINENGKGNQKRAQNPSLPPGS